jgi:bacteriocin biosynthesis cyclodehydratase domain-containing protein
MTPLELSEQVRLPPAVRLRPHHPLLCRTADSVQFGMAHRGGVEVVDLSPPLWRLFRLLTDRVSWRIRELVELGVRFGADAGEVWGLLAELYAAGALLDDELALRRTVARRSAYLLVQGCGPLLLPMVAGLGAAGVGRLGVRFATDARERRVPLDQLRAELGRVAPRTSLEQHKPKTRIDLAVVTDTLAPGRNLELELLGVPALVVRVCDDLGLVGPLVLPGRTACQHCLDLHRIDQDPFFSTLHAQLGQLVGSAGPATLQATAALAVEQALLGLDALVAPAQPPPTLDAVLELDLRRGRLHRRPWSPHPECGCGAADTVPGAAVFEAVTSYAAAPDGPLEGRNPTSPCVSSASG